MFLPPRNGNRTFFKHGQYQIRTQAHPPDSNPHRPQPRRDLQVEDPPQESCRCGETSDKEAAAAAYNTFSSAVDKAAKVGTIPANRAANYKSKAAKAIAKIA